MPRVLSRKLLALFCAVILAAALCGCGWWEDSVQREDPDGVFRLTLGHGLSEDHAVHQQLTAFAQAVEEESEGSIHIEVIPDGLLGSELENLAQIQAGGLDMAKVSASTLGNYDSRWNALSVPYLFRDREHFYQVMDGEIAQTLYETTREDGFVGLTWLDSGARSFYTVETPIRTPEDLAGLKIRVMDSAMAIQMMNALGGSSVIMDYADVASALEQGGIDGAENNITALRDHGALVGYYCEDAHTRIPDVVVISTAVWEAMTEEQRQIMTECGAQASEEYKDTWQAFEDQVRASVQGQVELVTDVDLPAFQAACQTIYDNLAISDPDAYAIVEQIQGIS